MSKSQVTYTNRKGITYYLCRGQTRTGRDRYYFARTAQGDPVDELPPGFAVSESVNGVVSLVRDRPTRLVPEDVAAVEAALAQHPQAHKYRIQSKHDRIEIFEDSAPDLSEVLGDLGFAASRRAALAEEFRARIGGFRYTPVLRFILDDATERVFRVERMCYRGSIDGWLGLRPRGSAADLARSLIPTLGTDRFFDLW
ncbi:MAG: hypothetical protein NVS2B16_19040 [Chloroflexota bacterium]